MDNRFLCRGKRVDNGEWVQGYYLHYLDHASDRHEIWWHNADAEHMQAVEIDPTTLGRCTGLEDKNGKLIFEGDLLRWYSSDPEFDELEDDSLCIVRWYQAGWHIDAGPDTVVMGCESQNGNGLVEWEIISTIHDTPGELGGEKGEAE